MQLGVWGSAEAPPGSVWGRASAKNEFDALKSCQKGTNCWQSFWILWSACFAVDRSEFSTN